MTGVPEWTSFPLPSIVGVSQRPFPWKWSRYVQRGRRIVEILWFGYRNKCARYEDRVLGSFAPLCSTRQNTKYVACSMWANKQTNKWTKVNWRGRGGGGGGSVTSQVHEQQFLFHQSRNKYLRFHASYWWVWPHWSVKLHQQTRKWIWIKPPDAS